MGKVIGLTGGIASGKSTVSRYLEDKGYIVLDSDKYAHTVLEPNQKGYLQIVDYFGEEILNDDKTINRRALGQIVFNDKEKLQQLNGFTHPEVRRMMQEDLDKFRKDNHVFLDIPLLYENKREAICDLVITVYVNERTQLERLMARNGFTEEEALSRIRSQMPLDEKKERSDIVFDNNDSMETLYQQIDGFLSELESVN